MIKRTSIVFEGRIDDVDALPLGFFCFWNTASGQATKTRVPGPGWMLVPVITVQLELAIKALSPEHAQTRSKINYDF